MSIAVSLFIYNIPFVHSEKVLMNKVRRRILYEMINVDQLRTASTISGFIPRKDQRNNYVTKYISMEEIEKILPEKAPYHFTRSTPLTFFP